VLRDESTTDPELDEVDEPEPERWLRCRGCGAPITRHAERIGDSADLGIHGGAFVNPHGYLHELEPFVSAPGAQEIGSPEERDSWFSGYTWTMAHCRACRTPLGWCFDAVDDRCPPRFWGLRTASLSG